MCDIGDYLEGFEAVYNREEKAYKTKRFARMSPDWLAKIEHLRKKKK